MSLPQDAAALARYLREATGARQASIRELRRLPEGAVQENWRVEVEFAGGDLDGSRSLVLRKDAATSLGLGLDRAGEFQVARTAHAAGVSTPEPLLLCTERTVIGSPFFVMRRISGEAAPQRIVSGALGGERTDLAAALAREMAAIHAVAPPCATLACLGAPPADAAGARLAQCAGLLADDPEPHPVAEWGLRWLDRHRPPPAAPVLCHGDFRTGNFLADDRGLTAILDWEFAGWSDPDEDIGWFCLGCWRFGAYEREAGGIVPRPVFIDAYERASWRRIDPARLRWWETMAALRWLALALRQRDRALIGGELSLDLALTGRRVAECEFEILKLTGAL
ncbi:MAG TPA: phosphotransferase family protein [Stellaceae bacterium]|nr:phosphotransferase family protein [Stellaceae bacterium]